jgi:hypothetical protein
MSGDEIMAGASVGITLVVLWLGLRPVGEATLKRWEERFSTTVPPDLRGEAASRLRHDRAWRTTAVAIGLLVGGAPAYMNLIDRSRAADAANPAIEQAWLMAAAFGALLAQLLVSQRPSGPRQAALVRRQVSDYVELSWVWVTGVLAFVAVVAAAVGAGSNTVDSGWWWLHAVGALAAMTAVGLGLRAVRDRGMLAAEGPRRDLDEALRADGAHHLVGAGVALAASSAAGALVLTSGSLVGLLANLMALGALGVWWEMTHRARWSVGARRITIA